MLLTGFAVAMGSAALGVTRLMRTMLFEARPLDAFAFASAALTLAAFALLACYIPRHRN